jgi:hypothetical protein
MRTSQSVLSLMLLMVTSALPAGAREYKYQTQITPGIATPDKVETSVGTLNLTDGYPKADTVETIYDNLDRSRALQAFLLGLPIAGMAAMRDGQRQFGPDNQTDVIWEDLLDSRTVFLTANDNVVYNFVWLDTHKGPLVVELPPNVLAHIVDSWQRWVVDMGLTGPDKGEGGKYLILPPAYDGAIPQGYFVVRTQAYGGYLAVKAFLVDGSAQAGIYSVKRNLKIYQLADAANPPPMTFANASGVPANFVYPTDASYWENLNKIIQEEWATGMDPTALGFFASIGIVKGKPFSPDARMKKILEDAANIGAVTARTIAYKIRSRDAYFYPNSSWRLPFFGGYKFESALGVSNLDGAAFFYYFAAGVSPSMDEKMIGKGSQYPWTAQDSEGRPFDGAKTYRLRLPPNVPAKDFWSAIVYDNQTRSMLQTDQRFPSVSSEDKDFKVNAGGSVDVYFGPKPPAGFEHNWVQTIPGKGWFMILRLYGPLQAWFDKTWRPGEIEQQG